MKYYIREWNEDEEKFAYVTEISAYDITTSTEGASLGVRFDTYESAERMVDNFYSSLNNPEIIGVSED